MKHLLYFLACTLCLLSCSSKNKKESNKQNQYFPLNKGNQWVYEASIKYHQKETDSLMEQKIEWTMEVTDTLHRGKNIAAIIKGFPTDLVWFEGTALRGDYILLQDSNKIYLNNMVSKDSLVSRFRDMKDSLTDLKYNGDILFDFPLKLHKTWGAEEDMPARSDSMYEWVVKKESTDTSAAEIQYMTNPDHSIFQFQPNIGITGYYFEHHGTVMELRMKLVRKTLH